RHRPWPPRLRLRPSTPLRPSGTIQGVGTRATRALLALTAAVAVTVTGPAATGAADRAPTCLPSQAAKDQPTNGNSLPPPAPRYFAKDFPTITDSRLHVPFGGLGGIRRHTKLHHTPVIFVHGNQADAQNWVATMLQF